MPRYEIQDTYFQTSQFITKAGMFTNKLTLLVNPVRSGRSKYTFEKKQTIETCLWKNQVKNKVYNKAKISL